MGLNPSQGKLPGSIHAGRATADNGNLFAGAGCTFRCRRILDRPAHHGHIYTLVNRLAGTALHAEVGADVPADRTWQGCMVQNQFICLIQFAVPDQAEPVNGRNMDRAVECTGRGSFVVGPVRYAPSEVSGLDQADGAAVQPGRQVAQGIAAKGLIPYLGAELRHGHGA